MSGETKSLFEQLYLGSEELIKKMKMPVAMRSLKRKLKAGYDDAQNIIDGADSKIEKEAMKLNDCDIQVILDENAKIRNAEEAQEDIKKTWKKLFGTDLVIEED